MRIDVLFALDQKPATFLSALLMATKIDQFFSHSIDNKNTRGDCIMQSAQILI